MENRMRKMKNLSRPLIVLIVLFVVMSIVSPNFLRMNNLMNIMRQVSINGVISAGLTLVILTGGIDLSVGSLLAFSGAIMALLSNFDLPFIVILLAGFGLGVLFGLINGLIITRFNVQAFIATLVSMMFLRGATLVLTNGRPIGIPRDGSQLFAFIGKGNIFGIPFPIIITIILYIILHYVLTKTVYGRHLYAVGGNERAASLSGINTKRVKTITYIVSGITSFIAALIVTSRLSSAQPTAGEGYEMDAIAAIVLGGTSMAGGYGTILGTFIGVLIIGIVNNTLNLLNVQSYYQQIAKAVIILIAVLMDRKK